MLSSPDDGFFEGPKHQHLMPQDRELGGPIYDVIYNEGNAIIRFGRDFERTWKENDKHYSPAMAPKGSHVWKTADAEIGKRMRRLAELDPPRSPAKVAIEGRLGKPLTVRIVDDWSGKAGVATSSEMGVLEEATGSAINAKSLSNAIGLLENSRWSISGEVDLSSLEDGWWRPMSWVKDTRRRALDSLTNSFAEEVVSGDASTKYLEMRATINDELVVDILDFLRQFK
mmetsp:Transcript_7151/g.12960  ORF Transcript_7151/g.12960 Transcript_7151/m.12960 type:complete len:228 (-) Transcript_7151:69-752(-)